MYNRYVYNKLLIYYILYNDELLIKKVKDFNDNNLIKSSRIIK